MEQLATDRKLTDRWLDLKDPEANRKVTMRLAILLLVALDDNLPRSYMRSRAEAILERAGV